MLSRWANTGQSRQIFRAATEPQRRSFRETLTVLGVREIDLVVGFFQRGFARCTVFEIERTES
jgi:hypothetical protein